MHHPYQTVNRLISKEFGVTGGLARIAGPAIAFVDGSAVKFGEIDFLVVRYYLCVVYEYKTSSQKRGWATKHCGTA